MAIQIVAGEPLRIHLPYLDPNGDPILGATFTVAFSQRPDGQSFPVDITEQGNGVYLVEGQTEVGDPGGEWYVLVQSPDGAQYDYTWDVNAIRPPVVYVQADRGAGHTRQKIRQIVASELGDLVLATATKNGTESTIFDAYNLALEVRHYNGMEVLCTDGHPANIGRTGTVTTSSQADQSVNFIPPFPMPTTIGDTFEMYNRRGTGWRVTQYNAAINAAISRAGDEHFTIPHTMEADTFDRHDGRITIPLDFSHFSGVEWRTRRGETRQLLPNFYTFDRFSRSVVVKGRYLREMSGVTPVIRGYIPPPLLEQDDHQTSIPLEWLIVEVKAELQNHDVSTGSTQGARDRLFYLDRQGADGRRQAIITTYAPNTRKLE